ncbi:tRNA-guanine(15) transglycosylase [Candidatus Methanoperedenaceae archaeon GB37]|nr:tRNA-guanine(15) transglycosylase [Candidatus Methanoperedenaceae archaeon GB37]
MSVIKKSHLFEIVSKDCAGRIGRLETPHGVIETPAILPVVNPLHQSIPPSELREIGAEGLVTNSYIIHRNRELRSAVLEVGVHRSLGFNGPIMTDSGSYQLSQYGSLDLSSREIVEFQAAIASDIGVPLDIPTPPNATFSRASRELDVTLERLREAISIERGEMLLAGTIQGSTFTELRRRASEEASRLGFDLYPIGAVVPLMESYRYRDLVQVIVASKEGLSPAAPVHLFGAGHPMIFALAVALGCDLFDSAAYALYAKDGRYMTSRGTYHIEDLRYLPCSCPICSTHTRGELAGDEGLIARHNLHVSFEEIRLVKQCIRDGSLWELVEERCRAHPSLLAGLKAAVSHSDWIERVDRMPKSTFFYSGPESARRSEVQRFKRYQKRFELRGRVLIKEKDDVVDDLDDFDYVMDFKPPFGAYPALLRESYPFNAEVTVWDHEAVLVAIENVRELIESNPDASFTLKKPGWVEEDLIKELEEYALVV